jgi:hypothetical protein
MSRRPRRFKVGDVAVWTDYTNGFRYKATILADVEPDAHDGYDEDAHGPLYQVAAGGSKKMHVAEEDLSPWPDDGNTADVIDGPAPRDPFTAYDTERATKEAGGQILATTVRANQDRLTIGAYIHPQLASLNCVTLRMYLDGKQTDALNFSADETLALITALRRAAEIITQDERHNR